MSYILDTYSGSGWYFQDLWAGFVYAFLLWTAWRLRLSWYYKPLAAVLLVGCFRIFSRAPGYTGHWLMLNPARRQAEVGLVRGFQDAVSAAQTGFLVLAACALFSAPLHGRWKPQVRWGLTGLALSVLVMTLCVTVTSGPNPDNRWVFLFFSNLALAECVYIPLLPIVWRQLPTWAGGLVSVLTAYSCHRVNENIGWGLLGLVGLLEVATINWGVAAVLAGLTTMQACFSWLPSFSYHLESRLPIWSAMLQTVWENRPWTGMGGGSAWTQIRYIQIPRGPAFLMAHNDYAQFFYEFGLIGLLAGLLSVGRLGSKCLNRPEYRASLLSFGAAATVHFPFHEPVAVVAMAGLLYLVEG